MKLAVCILVFALLGGCATFKSGDAYSYSRGEGSRFGLPEGKHINVLVSVAENYDPSEGASVDAQQDIIKRIKPLLENSGYQVTFLSQRTDDIVDYIEISVVLDYGHDFREDDFTGWRFVGALVSGLTLSIIPSRDIDIFQYIVFKNVVAGEVVSETVFEQDTHRYMGLFFLFISPFYTINDSLLDTVESSLVAVIAEKA